jgi:hypothetical protein
MYKHRKVFNYFITRFLAQIVLVIPTFHGLEAAILNTDKLAGNRQLFHNIYCHMVKAKPISIILLSVPYASSQEFMQLPSHTAEECGIGLTAVKHITNKGRSNWNKYIIINYVLCVTGCVIFVGLQYVTFL